MILNDANPDESRAKRNGDVVQPSSGSSPGLRAQLLGPEKLPLLLLLSVFGFAFGDTLLELVERWCDDPNYSHGFVVPAVSYLIYRQRVLLDAGSVGVASRRGAVGVLWSIGAIAVAMGIRLATVLVPSLFLDGVSMLLAMAGCVRLVGGPLVWRHARAPLLFLIFMVPWPAPIHSQIAFPLQQVVCVVAGEILDLLSVPVLREGNLLHLPNETMHVAEACSGLRQLTAFLAIGVCGALLLQRPIWYRAAVLLTTVPIAVALNVLRVVATGLIVHAGKDTWTQGVLHDLEGLIMVGLGLLSLTAACKVFDWIGELPASRSWGSVPAWSHPFGRVMS
ncbi:MAG: exosortase/archaeosortase family protein [Planctomycetota bacterium]